MEEKIIKILEKVCGTNEISDNMDLNLFDAGLLDSLGFIELVVAFESELGITVEPTELDRKEIETANKIILFVRSKMV